MSEVIIYSFILFYIHIEENDHKNLCSFLHTKVKEKRSFLNIHKLLQEFPMESDLDYDFDFSD